MYIETSSNNHGHERVFLSFERSDIIQFSIITFFYIRYSTSTNDLKKSMGRFRLQLLLPDNTWSTRYNIPKNDRYSNTSTQWTKLSLNFTVKNYGINLIYDQRDTPQLKSSKIFYPQKSYCSNFSSHCIQPKYNIDSQCLSQSYIPTKDIST